ncbi:hypothetical protein BpHYR1_022912 [Brachionus plicatilis]|uniref:Uncharacterized protein n=1 Tax=Brachionus plicatilis TaxID=10195 RepID=A0A3M7T5S5_BRAPC|nr:hypothetical protein BpHYR1_022912 [Brachionus plicatilis]
MNPRLETEQSESEPDEEDVEVYYSSDSESEDFTIISVDQCSQSQQENTVFWYSKTKFTDPEVTEAYMNNEGVWKFNHDQLLKTCEKAMYRCSVTCKCPAKAYLKYISWDDSVSLFVNGEKHYHSFKRKKGIGFHIISKLIEY